MTPTAIVITLNIIFVVLLMSGLLFGYKRGLEFSTLHICFIFFALLLAIFITNPISASLLNIRIDGQKLSQIILGLSGGVANVSPTLTSATIGTIASLISPIVFIVVASLLALIFEIVYQLIVRLYIKKKNIITKNPKRKWYGMLVGLAETFVFFMLIFMPLTSLSKTFVSIASDSNVNTSTTAVATQNVEDSNGTSIKELINDYVPKDLILTLEKYNTSPMAKLVEFGGLDNIVYRAITRIKGDRSYNVKDDFAEFVDHIDKFVQSASYYYENYESASIEPVKESLSELLHSPFGGFMKRVMRDLIDNPDKLAEELNFDEKYANALKNVLDTYKDKLDDNNFSFADYLDNNFDIVLNAVDNLAKTGGLKDLLEIALNGANLESLINASSMTSFASASQILVEAPVLKDCYPVLREYISDFPVLVRNLIDVDYLDTYEKSKEEFPKVFNILKLLATTQTSNGDLLNEIMNSDQDYSKDLIMSDNAVEIIKAISDAKSARALTFSVFYDIDDKVRDALREICGKRINDRAFTATISYSDDLDVQFDFLESLKAEAEDFVDLARYAFNNDLNRQTLPTLMEKMRVMAAKKLDKATHKSSSIIAATFSNLVNTFSGKILAVGSVIAFDNYELFEQKVNEAFADLDTDEDENNKYFLVDYENILKDLI